MHAAHACAALLVILTPRIPLVLALLVRSYDNAAYEVSPPATAILNKRVATHGSSVYIAFAANAAPNVRASAQRSARSLRRKVVSVAREVAVRLFSLCVRLGGGGHRCEACGRMGLAPEEWEAHDGLLSVAGQRTPLGEPCVPLPPYLAEGFVGKWDDEPSDAAAAVVGCGASGDADAGAFAGSATPDAAEAEDASCGPDACPPRTPSTADVCAATVGRALERVVSGASLCPPPSLERGVWHTHELEVDHFSVCGGPLASPPCIDAFWDMYCRRLRPAF